MLALKDLLPEARNSTSTCYDHANEPWFKQRFSMWEEEKYSTPPYLKRGGFVPRKVEDFGDGGAFPEIHIAQYPLCMGREKGSKILPLTVDAIVKQNENVNKIVYSQYKDLIPNFLKNDEEEEEEEKQREVEETTQETKAALEKIVNVRLSAAQPKSVPKQSSDSKYIKYKPSVAKARIIRMVEMAVDPAEPPRFKHKRVPKASGSPPVPVMQSPPRPVTVKDMEDWKIPPCISNWKNPKGYTIPLDKRLAADGRGLHEVQINDNFAKLSEALYVAEHKAIEAVAMRSKLQKEIMIKEKERKEAELRALAAKARSERTRTVDTDMRDMPKESREKIRKERRRERERERRLEAKDAVTGKKRKITGDRDRDRDISEKVALGMASRGAQVMYDERLFNQEKGMDSGFATDDQYNIYDNGLFTAQPTLATLYRPKKDMDSDMYGKPDKAFDGTSERIGPRDRSVDEFEKEAEEADPFGLDHFWTEVRSDKKA